MPRRNKIALIGAGNIGGELATLAARKELGDVVLFDIPEKESFAKGKALDIEQTNAVTGIDAEVTATNDHHERSPRTIATNDRHERSPRTIATNDRHEQRQRHRSSGLRTPSGPWSTMCV